MNKISIATILRHPLAIALLLALLIASAALTAGQARAGRPAPASATTATTITGDITTDTTWNRGGSPYLVVNPIKVLSTATLTIEKGVEVRFSPAAGLTVQGGLNAQGTQGLQVRMVPDDNLSWLGLTAIQPARNVTLQSVTLKSALAGLSIQQGPTPKGQPIRVAVLDSLLEANGTAISADLASASGSLRLTMRNTLLTRNGIGLLLSGDPQAKMKVKLNHNSFTQNGIGIKVVGVGGKGLKAQQQWWGDAAGPLANTPACGASPAPGLSARDLVCGNVDYVPWSKVPSGRIIVDNTREVRVESEIGPAALSDDETAVSSMVTLTVPLGTFDQPVDLLVAPRPAVDPTLTGAAPPGTPTLLALEVTAVGGGQEIHAFPGRPPLRLDISYIDQDLGGASPDRLMLAFFDEAHGAWSFDGFVSQPEPATHHLTAYLLHLTRMRITARGPDSDFVFMPLVKR